MPYLYHRYNNKPDTEEHVSAFLTMWQANHVSQHLVEADANASKIVKFELSLDDQETN